ncbi:MAG: glutathione S-transferase [Caulobacter sp.]|nr:glutathione S-transferase [Caulobacter sp.]
MTKAKALPDQAQEAVADPVWRVYGLSLSYFTGKIEAYLRAKGQDYRLIEMSAADLRRCASITGVAWMPQVEMDDGRWLTDSCRIIEYVEARSTKPAITPANPAVAFVAGLIEDFGDEQLWRPALYYRWAFAEDQRLRGEQIARTMLRELRLPLWLKTRIVIARQRRVYMAGDGVTSDNRFAVEAEYLHCLDALEPVLASQPFVLGDRPTEADFGLFGGLFRHFAEDPTPAAIMASRAPAVLAWTRRLWSLRPQDFSHAPKAIRIPENLGLLALAITSRFLPMLSAHQQAWANGAALARYEHFGARFETRVNPYRVWRLARLQGRFAALPEEAALEVEAWLSDATAVRLLRSSQSQPVPQPISLPIPPANGGRLDRRPRDRQWRRE